MSGVRTGRATIQPVLLPTQKALHLVRTGCSVAAAGASAPGTAGRPIAAGASPASVAAAWGSGLLFPQVSELSKARNGESARVDTPKGIQIGWMLNC